ncbi:MAG TPA: GDSL-type esterase/lipase family protein, partial [Polyangiaceae bacterium]|nr:GDSL-type esterase/lipase family protein [Polyangiaceae bacterium]
APFYDKLATLARGRATDHVRIAVFGDSNLTMDFTTGRMRRRLSQEFGEGGHGFVALGKPWSHYRHMDVVHDVVRGFEAYAITTKPTGDGVYGLAGIAVENSYQGARTFAATAPETSPIGRAVSRFDLFYLERPRGGAFDVEIDHALVRRIETAGGAKSLTHAAFDVPEGPHRIDVVSRSAAQVRVFGVALERASPGIVVDAFGVGALNSKTLARTDPAAFEAMARARRYDLVIFMTGANDVFTLDAVPDAMRHVVGMVREALPDAAVLVVTPADRGIVRPFPQTLKVVEQRRALAREEGWALWDQFAAMGGAGSMKHFKQSELAYKDGVHFTERGGARMGDLFVDALLAGFAEHLEMHPDAGCATKNR